MTPEAGPPTPPQSSGNAVVALVLGIVGLVMCGPVTAVPAIVLGHRAMREIDESGGRLEGRGLAQAGYILGIVGTVIGGLVLLFVVFVFLVGAFVVGTR